MFFIDTGIVFIIRFGWVIFITGAVFIFFLGGGVREVDAFVGVVVGIGIVFFVSSPWAGRFGVPLFIRAHGEGLGGGAFVRGVCAFGLCGRLLRWGWKILCLFRRLFRGLPSSPGARRGGLRRPGSRGGALLRCLRRLFRQGGFGAALRPGVGLS